MFKVMILSLCVFSATALKLQQEPEFDVTDALYNEECGNRFNYKCWRKGGHSLDKEEAAYIVEFWWSRPTYDGNDALGNPADGTAMEGGLKVTWNKAITASGNPILKVNKYTATGSTNADISFPFAANSGKVVNFESTTNAVAIGDKWQVKVNAIKVDMDKTIKNAGKSKDADVSQPLPNTGPIITETDKCKLCTATKTLTVCTNEGKCQQQCTASDRVFAAWTRGYKEMTGCADTSLQGAQCTAIQTATIALCYDACVAGNGEYFAYKDANSNGCMWCDATGTTIHTAQTGFTPYRLPHQTVKTC